MVYNNNINSTKGSIQNPEIIIKFGFKQNLLKNLEKKFDAQKYTK
jgi:hypothetical protein